MNMQKLTESVLHLNRNKSNNILINLADKRTAKAVLSNLLIDNIEESDRRYTSAQIEEMVSGDNVDTKNIMSIVRNIYQDISYEDKSGNFSIITPWDKSAGRYDFYLGESGHSIQGMIKKFSSAIDNYTKVQEKYYEGAKGKLEVPLADALSHSFSESLTSTIEKVKAGQLDFGMDADAINRRFHSYSQTLTEGIIKEIKGNGTLDEKAIIDMIKNGDKNPDALAQVLGKHIGSKKEYAIFKHLLGLSLNNMNRSSEWLGDILTNTRTFTDESSSYSISAAFTKNSFADNMNFLVGKYAEQTHGNQSMNEFMDSVLKSRNAKLMAGVALTAGLFSLINPNQTPFYDTTIQGTGGEANDTQIDFSFNSPISFFRRELKPEISINDRLSRMMQRRQKLILDKSYVQQQSKEDRRLVNNRGFYLTF